MTLFQYLALSALGGLVLWELLNWRRGRGARAFWLGRLLVWLVAAVAIAFPDTLTVLSWVLGIGRGADLVLYVFILAFVGVSFYFYSRYVRLQRRLTEVVRHLAILEARRGGEIAD